MAYFLKKQKQGNQMYLAIYDSFYSPQTKGTKHRCYQSLGSVEKLLSQGIQDPLAYGKDLVDKLNSERSPESDQLISDSPVIKHLGYFPLRSLLDKLGVRSFIDLFKLTNSFHYDLYTLISSLIFARAVKPCSKYKTYTEVLPSLFEPLDYSYDQLLDGLEFIGADYQKFIELFYTQYCRTFGSDTSSTYFDCTNFYFEIDREDDLRRKGPSKENRKDPIVGMGLLLDADQVPVWMKIYPGNQSEKPILRDCIRELKERNGIVGRTIHVADKGLNCAENIAFSRENNDGYIFSKSVKQLPETEKVWVKLESGWHDVKDRKGELLYRYKSCIDSFPYKVERNGKKVTVKLKEKRLLTYNPSLAKKKEFEINRMVEKARALCASQAKRAEFGECSKFVDFNAIDKTTGEVSDDAIALTINEDKILKEKEFAGYNLIVTSETGVKDQELYAAYHNLWRIEESFRIMKTDLDARPVYLQKQETIIGHFLICYLTVMLERILQMKVFKRKYSSNELYDFFKDFCVIEVKKEYINTSRSTEFITELSSDMNLPLNHMTISQTKLNKILNYKL